MALETRKRTALNRSSGGGGSTRICTRAHGEPPSASLSPHPILDARLLDGDILVRLLNTWVGADATHVTFYEVYDDDAKLGDRTAIAFTRMDVRFASALCHRYRVRRDMTLSVVLNAWHRRIAECGLDHCAASASDRDHSASAAFDRPRYMPLFSIVQGSAEEWLEAAPLAWLLVRISDRRLVFTSCSPVASRLPVTSLDALLNAKTAQHRKSLLRALVASLQHLPQLTLLDLSRNRIGQRSCCALVSSLQYVPHLTVLNLRGNEVGVQGCRAVAASLLHIPQLTVLNLYCNVINPAGCRALAASLTHVPRLLELDVGEGSICDEGCRALAASLQHVPRLTSLSVKSCNFGAEGSIALAESLHHVPQLTKLDMSYNNFGVGGCSVLAASLLRAPQVELILDAYNFGAKCREALRTVLDRVEFLRW